jgi:hypothetical protein
MTPADRAHLPGPGDDPPGEPLVLVDLGRGPGARPPEDRCPSGDIG